jgi:hydrogenase nickel incorporation protein HypA/HybF
MHRMPIAPAVAGRAVDAARSHGHATVGPATPGAGGTGEVPGTPRLCSAPVRENAPSVGAAPLVRRAPGRPRRAPRGPDRDTGLPPQLCCPCCGGAAGGPPPGREPEFAGLRRLAQPRPDRRRDADVPSP